MFTKKEESYCKCDQFCVDTFSLPFLLLQPGPSPYLFTALTRSADLASWPVEMRCSPYLTFSPFAAVSLCGVAGLAQTFPSITVSGPFLLDTLRFHVSLDRVLPPQLWSSSRALPLHLHFDNCSDVLGFVHHIMFLIFEWVDHLVVDDACYTIHALFSACLLVSSWCFVSSRSKCVIAFVCPDSDVRTGRARRYFTVIAG